jgi:hypothetical protein
LSSTKKDPLPEGESVTIPIRRDAPPSVEDGQFSSRSMVLGALGAALLFVAVLVGLKVFVADKTPDLTEESFQAALQQWQARGPASYDLDVQIGGAQPGVAHVEVRNGDVKVATRDGLPLQDWNKDEWSIAGQFEALEREFEFAENPQREMQAPPGARVWLRCEFDPEYGYPRRFHRHTSGGAPEVFWRATSFTPK